MASLVALLDRLGRYEAAATIAGFARSPFSASTVPKTTTAMAHVRDVLGEAVYGALVSKGEMMTTAAMVTFAHEKIDQARRPDIDLFIA